MGKTIVIDNQNPTLETVNQNLLRKLNNVIDSLDETDTVGLLNITESVAKLNASSRNNDKLSQPKTEKEEANSVVRSMFGSKLSEAQVVDGEEKRI